MNRTPVAIFFAVLASFLLVGAIICFIKLMMWGLPIMLNLIVGFVVWWWSQADLVRFWIIPSCILALILTAIYLDSKYIQR
jgi:hypothetical protein